MLILAECQAVLTDFRVLPGFSIFATQQLACLLIAQNRLFSPSHATLRPSFSESMPNRLMAVDRCPISMSHSGVARLDTVE